MWPPDDFHLLIGKKNSPNSLERDGFSLKVILTLNCNTLTLTTPGEISPTNIILEKLIGSLPSIRTKKLSQWKTLNFPFTFSRGKIMFTNFRFIFFASQQILMNSIISRDHALLSMSLSRCQGRQITQPRWQSKSSWAGSYLEYFLLTGPTHKIILMTFSHLITLSRALMTQNIFLPPWFAEILQNMNFHVETTREKYNFPIESKTSNVDMRGTKRRFAIIV